MGSHLLFNIRPFQIRMASVEKGNQLKNISYYQPHSPSLVGTIYKGKISKVVSSLSFVFVDLGEHKSGFLYKKDLYEKQQKSSDFLKKNKEVMVQVKSDPSRHKGARLTTDISLSGFYVVYVPNHVKKIVFSRKIQEEKEKERIEKILKSFSLNGTLIVRTLAQGKSEKEIKTDLQKLVDQWQDLKQKFKTQKHYGKLESPPDPLVNYMKDFMHEKISKILVDDETTCVDLKKKLQTFYAEVASKIKNYSKDEPLFERFKIEKQIKRLQEKKVQLKNGGSLVFEELEAFVVIDVNTSRYTGKKQSTSESLLSMNLEAAKVIAEQTILRDLGGIILIDFIDMDHQEDRKKVVQFLKEELEKDKNKTKVYPMGDLGLVQITRRRKKQSLFRSLQRECSACDGKGYVSKIPTKVAELFLQLEGQSSRNCFFMRKKASPQVFCHPSLKTWIDQKEQKSLEFLKNKHAIEPRFVVDSQYQDGFFKIKED